MNACPPPSADPVFNSVLFNAAVFGGKPPADHAVVQVGHGLIYPALRKANITIGPQRIPSEAQFQDAIEELNRLIGILNCDPLSIYSLDIEAFPLQKGKKTYTIGRDPQGCVCADFDVPRPQGIEYANTILTSSGTPLRFPLQLYTDQQWANVSLQDIGNSIPWALYNNQNHPISTLYLYGQPIADMLLELYMWHLIPTFTSLCDVVVLPPGYEDVLVLNLACRLAPHFQRVVNPDVTAQARESLMRLLSYNAPQPIAAVNGFCRGGDTTFTMIAGAGGRPGGVGLNDPTQTLGDLLVRGSSAVNRLPIGNPGDVLTVDPATWLGVEWRPQATAAVQSVFGRTGAIVAEAGDYTVDMITGAMADPLIARGDLLVRGPADTTRLPVGADNEVLLADSSNLLGVRWATLAIPAVESVFGRAGVVLPASGDYTAAQVTNAVDATQVYNDPPWLNSLNFFKLTNVPPLISATRSINTGTGLTGGGDLSQDRTLSVVSDSTVQRVQVSQNGTLSGTRSQINFIAGANTTLSAVDNASANRIDVTISATGGGGAGGVSAWNTRTGNVVPASGDYTAAMVVNAVSTQGSYADPAWLTSLAWSKISGTPATFPPSAHTHDAGAIVTGVIATARLGTGAASGSTYLRGDGAWAAVAGGQTPWTSDIDAGTYTLRNITGITIGANTAPTAAVPLWMMTSTVQFPILIANTSATGMAGIRMGNDLSQNLQFGIGGSTNALYGVPGQALIASDVDLLIRTANAERIRITASGNIGVNNPNPAYRLDVTGGFRVNAATNQNLMVGPAAEVPGAVTVNALNDANANIPLEIRASQVVLRNSILDVQSGASGDQIRFGPGAGFQYHVGRSSANGLCQFIGDQAGGTGYEFVFRRGSDGGFDIALQIAPSGDTVEIRMQLGGVARILSVDTNGFVRAT